MAEAKKQKAEEPETPKEAVKATEPAEDAIEFSVERLISEGGQLIGHEPHVVAGALNSVNRKNLTLEEAEAAVDAWLKKPVSQEA
jgi:hypothetical protein